MTLLFLISTDNDDKLQLGAKKFFIIIPFCVLTIALLLTQLNRTILLLTPWLYNVVTI